MQRRVFVTGRDADGRSMVVKEGPAGAVTRFVHTPGMVNELLWSSDPATSGAGSTYVPAPGGSRLMVVQFPPDDIYASSAFDPEAAAREQRDRLPGLAELFEEDAPGFHQTPTIDYVVVLDGTPTLELDVGEPVELGVGDIVVQNYTRHAWRNNTSTTATILVVLIGTTEA